MEKNDSTIFEIFPRNIHDVTFKKSKGNHRDDTRYLKKISYRYLQTQISSRTRIPRTSKRSDEVITHPGNGGVCSRANYNRRS